jgi:hypothetical protein
MLKQGRVKPEWWLEEDSGSNAILPGYMRVYHEHKHMSRIELQKTTARAIWLMNRLTAADAARQLKAGWKHLGTTLYIMISRVWISRQGKKFYRKLTQIST